jgi:DNA-directed RNA polymerase specialized sigma24 family protein
MDALPTEQREALALRESRGLKFGEIADLLGLPVATVKPGFPGCS